MSWRIVVITDCAKLDYKLDYLVVRKVDQVTRVHLSEIRLLLVESTAVSMTSRLLCELVKKKIKVIFCEHPHCGFKQLAITLFTNSNPQITILLSDEFFIVIRYRYI